MENELKPWRFGVSLGLVFAIISLICAILIAIAPEFIISIANNIFHSIDFNSLMGDLSWGSVVIGLIEIFIIGFIGGWLFAVIYNKLK